MFIEEQGLERLSIEILNLELSPDDIVQLKWASLVMNEPSFTEWPFISLEEASM